MAGLQSQIDALSGTVGGLPTMTDVTNAINSALANYYTKSQVDALIQPIHDKVNALVTSQNGACTAIKTLVPAATCSTITTLP